MISGGLVLLVFAFVLFRFLPSELVPTEDRGIGFGIVIAPEGATLEYTDTYVREIERRLLALPETPGSFHSHRIRLWRSGKCYQQLYVFES